MRTASRSSSAKPPRPEPSTKAMRGRSEVRARTNCAASSAREKSPGGVDMVNQSRLRLAAVFDRITMASEDARSWLRERNARFAAAFSTCIKSSAAGSLCRRRTANATNQEGPRLSANKPCKLYFPISSRYFKAYLRRVGVLLGLWHWPSGGDKASPAPRGPHCAPVLRAMGWVCGAEKLSPALQRWDNLSPVGTAEESRSAVPTALSIYGRPTQRSSAGLSSFAPAALDLMQVENAANRAFRSRNQERASSEAIVMRSKTAASRSRD